MYTKDQANKIIADFNEMERFIGNMGKEIAAMRKHSLGRNGGFEKYEMENQGEVLPEPEREEDYYDGGDGDWYHYDNGSSYNEAMEKYTESKMADRKIIRAIYYLGYESEHTSIEFPASYLWTENWKEIEANTIADQKAKEEAIEQAKQEKRRLDKSERFGRFRTVDCKIRKEE